MSSQHLKPPPTTHRAPSSASTSGTSTPTAGPPKAPVSAHPSSTIAETVLFQGTHPVSIDAETIIHPRAKVYSFEGPVRIGRGCVIGEKCVIGLSPDASPSKPGIQSHSTTDTSEEGSEDGDNDERERIDISRSVTISPLANILPGSTIEEAAIIDTLATIDRRAKIGRHTKVCAGCIVPVDASVGEWMVVWGSADGFGRRKRKRIATTTATAAGSTDGTSSTGLDGRVVEESRLLVLTKEREALSRMLVPAGASRRR